MMNNFFNLSKVYLKQSLSKFTVSKNKKTRSLVSTLFIIGLILAIFEFSICTMMESFIMMTPKTSWPNLLCYGLMISALISVLMLAFEIPALFYKSKDYENLASLPISPIVVVSAKFFSGYVTGFVYNAVFALPTMIYYFVYCSASIGAIAMLLSSLLLLPMFAMFLGSIIGFVVHSISSKLKNKTMFTTILMLVFMGGYFALSFSGEITDITMFMSGELPLWFKIVLPYVWFLFEAVSTGNMLYYLFFVLLCLAYVLLSILIVTSTYRKVNSNMLTVRKSISKKPITFKEEGIFKTLLKKEAKGFFGSSVWSVNTLCGPILIIVMAIAFGTMGLSYTKDLGLPLEVSAELFGVFKLIYFIMVSVMSSFAMSSFVSISMEGKKIQILKQLPISFKIIAASKILFSIMLVLPAVFVANIIYLCFIPFDLIFAILLFVTPTISVSMFGVFGLFVNLCLPKMDWTNEAQAVKQSASTFVSIFGTMAVGAVPAIIHFAIIKAEITAIKTLGLISIGWFALCFVASAILLKVFGKKLFEKIG